MSGSDLVVFQETARRLGATVLPDNAQYEYRMHIKSASSDSLYVVARRKSDRVWTCGCRGWIRHRNCKHLTTMVPSLESMLRRATVGTTAEPSPAPRPAAKPAAPTPTPTRIVYPSPVKAPVKPVSPVRALLDASAALDRAVNDLLSSTFDTMAERTAAVRAAQVKLRAVQSEVV